MPSPREGIRAALEPFSPSRFPYRGFVLALALGTLGGMLFAWWRLPLPWMLGAMTACLIASLAGAPVRSPAIVRPPMTMIIGVMLGASFSPEIVSGMGAWIPTILGLAAFVVVSGLACVTYFRKVAGLDLPTAYFAGMPGGLLEMVILADEQKADARTVALIQSARVMLIVFSLPVVLRLAGATGLGERPAFGASIFDTPLSSEIWLVATALIGALAGRALRFPAPDLLGPMLVSGLVHALGWTGFRPPYELLGIAQVVLGASIGCRFAGTPLREVARIVGLSLGSTAILVFLTVAFSLLLSGLTGTGLVPLLLAYSPGGLAETSLIALALQIDTALVATHHICRVLFVMVGAGAVFKLLPKRGS